MDHETRENLKNFGESQTFVSFCWEGKRFPAVSGKEVKPGRKGLFPAGNEGLR